MNLNREILVDSDIIDWLVLIFRYAVVVLIVFFFFFFFLFSSSLFIGLKNCYVTDKEVYPIL